MIEYDAHEPGTWRDAALHFRAENERLTAELAAVTAERDALREAGDAMSCELALIASDITPKGPRGQIANHPHEVAALKKVKQIAFAREQWRAALAARGGGG